MDEKTVVQYSVPAVERAFSLLRYIADGNRCRNLSKTSKAIGINRTTLIRLIHTLLDSRMIEEIGEEEGYRLGSGLISLAAQSIHSRDIVQIAQPILRNLMNELDLSAHLGILDGIDIVYICRETPNTHLISNIRVGSRLPAHSTTIGRAILSSWGDGDVDKLFAGLEDQIEMDVLIKQLQQDRMAQHTWSMGNYESGIGSCGAVIFDHSSKAVAGINVTGPDHRFANDRPDNKIIKSRVMEAANIISNALGFVGLELPKT